MKSFTLYLLAICATLSGLVLLASLDSTAQAAVTNFTSKWQANRVVMVQFPDMWMSRPIGIGVSQWKVTGQYAPMSFKETWSVNGESNLDLTYRSLNGKAQLATSSAGFDPSKWQIGLVSFHYTHIYTQDFSALSGPRDKLDVAIGNGAIQCGGDDRDCLYASGNYGFTFAESIDQNRKSSSTDAAGTFAPTAWDVTGVICKTVDDAACQ